MTEVTFCPICKSKDLRPVFTAIDHSVSHETFSIVQCQTCALRITSPRPDNSHLKRYYESDNYISHKKNATSFLDYIYKVARVITLNKKLNLVRNSSLAPPASLIDYGCGTGAFLQKCKAEGLIPIGVEPSAAARKIAVETGALDVKETLAQVASQADVITLWHVLEHVPDLHTTLSELHAHLKQNGTMFIAVPNYESHDARKYGTYWAGYDVPRHLWHFGKTNMTQLLAQHNLQVVKILPMKLDAFYVSILSEKYQNRNYILTLLNGFLSGLSSNMKARDNNYSSLIYVIRKK